MNDGNAKKNESPWAITNAEMQDPSGKTIYGMAITFKGVLYEFVKKCGDNETENKEVVKALQKMLNDAHNIALNDKQ